jgi:endonuclease YncB( thermonuclease family)
MARGLGLLAVLFATVTQAQERAGATSLCKLETFATALAGAAVDGRTFMLDDGRAVRLSAIEVPSADTGDPRAAAGTAAKAALEKLLAGNKVVLKRLGAQSDRYGHLVAHVFVIRDGAEHWVEHDMIAAGQARLGARIGDRGCTEALRAAERGARQAKLGLWADPYYALRQADNAAELLGERGRFTVIEGKVLSVREAGATIYINFGRVWSRNLTVTILKRNERAFTAAGIEPKKLESRRVRVRGWVEERGGPRLEAARPEQIEILDRDDQG